MRRLLVFATILAALFLVSCARQETGTTPEEGGRRATVVLKDGTTAEGSVVASSGKEITITGDDRITRTIPMDQVRSIEYGDPDSAGLPEDDLDAQSQASKPRAAAPVQPQKARPAYELPVGTNISVRTFEAIDSATAAEGQTFPGEITQDVSDPAGNVIIPARSSAQITIKSASRGGRIRGASDLVLDLESVTVGRQRYSVQTTDISKAGKSGIGANKRTATYTGGGAAVGAIIGAIAGGGKGAAIGAASGAGAGALTQILTKGGSIKVPAETVLTFELNAPLRVAG